MSHYLNVGDLVWYRFSEPSQIGMITSIDYDDNTYRYTILLTSGEERKPHVNWVVPVNPKQKL
jgi:hypothetical protein